MSSTNNSRFAARYSSTDSSSAPAGQRLHPQHAASVSHTASGSATGASSHNHAPSGNSATTSAATWSARRVLPTPPTPVSVTRRRPQHELRQRRDLGLAADERRDLTRQVARQRVQRPQRRELRAPVPARHLEHRARRSQVAQPVLAQIDQLDSRSRTSRRYRSRTTTCPPCATPISRARTVQLGAEVVAVAQFGLTGVQPHPHPQDGSEPQLRSDRRRACVRSPTQTGRHTVAGVLEQEPAMLSITSRRRVVFHQVPASPRGSSSHRRVEPSTSVNRNVTVPEGTLPTTTATASHGGRAPGRRSPGDAPSAAR